MVTIDWVAKSLDNHALQDEAPFEVNKNCKALCDGAPAKARLSASALRQVVYLVLVWLHHKM